MNTNWLVSPWGVFSVWWRHALVYRRTWLVNFLPPVTEPLLYLISFGFGISPMVGEFRVQGRVMNYLQFISPAMIAVGVCFQSFFEGAYGSFIRLDFSAPGMHCLPDRWALRKSSSATGSGAPPVVP